MPATHAGTGRNRNASSLSISIPISPQRHQQLSRDSKTPATAHHHPSFPESSSWTPKGLTKAPTSSSYYYYPDALSPSNPEKPPGFDPYPNGPVLVCEPNIYLFSEPSADAARQFDVVVNVAKEVSNPFAAPPSQRDSPTTTSLASSVSSRTSCFSQQSQATASLPSSVDSADPSSVPPVSPTSEDPEYVYVPWDHNSKLTPDLERLTDLIKARSASGKRILIHCQCGVSRSASLVVAYVMRSNDYDLNTAYEFVKKRSPHISPNMTLMFQLMDWSRLLRRGGALVPDDLDDLDDDRASLSAMRASPSPVLATNDTTTTTVTDSSSASCSSQSTPLTSPVNFGEIREPL